MEKQKQYVIYSGSETWTGEMEEPAFWNNTEGWVILANATIFNEQQKEHHSLPLTAFHDARWVELPDPANAVFQLQRLEVQLYDGFVLRAEVHKGFMFLAISRTDVAPVQETSLYAGNDHRTLRIDSGAEKIFGKVRKMTGPYPIE